ncbi:hypothetical protein [Glycomyces arizonensis]|uniref:hypothetical protein n=1 Tax=Glycomyces arizonensis TaxID=256035 RepID=UPI00040BB1A3|nr:hypothetical protein [Glycomyces arizonensis]
MRDLNSEGLAQLVTGEGARPLPEYTGRTPSEIARDMIRRASGLMLEQSKNLPAPCGCAPKTGCDRHCRVKIRQQIDDDGRAWVAECDGSGPGGHIFRHGDGRVWCLNLPALHKAATEHVAEHRLAAFART